MPETEYELATRRVWELSEELANLRTRIEQLAGEESKVSQALQAWRIIQTTEAPAGHEHLLSADDSDVVEFVANDYTPAEGETWSTPVRLLSDELRHGHRTALIRSVLKIAGATGVTPRVITSFVEIGGRKLRANFASNALFKMRERGEVELINGRYRLKEFCQRPSSRPIDG